MTAFWSGLAALFPNAAAACAGGKDLLVQGAQAANVAKYAAAAHGAQALAATLSIPKGSGGSWYLLFADGESEYYINMEVKNESTLHLHSSQIPPAVVIEHVKTYVHWGLTNSQPIPPLLVPGCKFLMHWRATGGYTMTGIKVANVFKLTCGAIEDGTLKEDEVYLAVVAEVPFNNWAAQNIVGLYLTHSDLSDITEEELKSLYLDMTKGQALNAEKMNYCHDNHVAEKFMWKDDVCTTPVKDSCYDLVNCGSGNSGKDWGPFGKASEKNYRRTCSTTLGVLFDFKGKPWSVKASMTGTSYQQLQCALQVTMVGNSKR